MGVSVREKQKGSGKWWIFIRHAGARISTPVKDGGREKADYAAQEIMREIRLGIFDIAAMKSARAKAVKEDKAPALPTLKEYFDRTLSPMWEASLSKSTFDSYEGSFRIHILPVLANIGMDAITRSSVKAFAVSLLNKTCIVRQKEPNGESSEVVAAAPAKPLSKETIRNILAALRAAFSEAVETGIVITNPAVKLGKLYKEAGTVHEEIDPFDAEDIRSLLETVLSKYGFDAYVTLLTLFHAGLRAGEAAGLEWPDLDFKTKLIHVRRQITRGRRGKTKTRKTRKVDMSTELLSELQELKRRRAKEYLAKGKNEIPDAVFINQEGQPLDMNNFRNRVYWKSIDQAKLRRRRLHDTRHTFATLLLQNGEGLNYVSKQLGHSSIRITADVYGHYIPGSNRAAMDSLPSLDRTVKTLETTVKAKRASA